MRKYEKKTNRIGKMVVLVGIGVILMTAFFSLSSATSSHQNLISSVEITNQSQKGLAEHAPIYIDGNADFSDGDDDGVINPDAAGTEADPYIIEGWDINASTAIGIKIRNTDVYFIIRNCVIYTGTSSEGFGIYFNQVQNGVINNVTSYDSYSGIFLDYYVNSNQITNSTFRDNHYGILMYFSSSNHITCNNITNNNWGVYMKVATGGYLPSAGNFLYHNNFIDSNVYDPYTNYWDDGTEGNYWDDYTGDDADGDGIGDTPYNISGGDNMDNYPLIEPVGVDTIKPKIAITGVENNIYYNVSVTPMITIFDLNLNTITVTLNGEDFTSGTMVAEDGTYTLFVQATDKMNNTAQQTITFTIDKTPPSITVTGVADNAYYNVSVIPIIDIADLNPKTTLIELNNAPFTSGTEVQNEGDYELFVLATDKAGNNISQIIIFTIDKTKPTIVVSGIEDGAYYNTDVVPIVDVTDDNLNITSITLNGNPFTSGTTISAGDTYVLVVQATDKAGNNANKTITFIIDKTAPVITITEPSQTINKNSFTMHWSTTANDVQYYEISTDGVNWVNVSTDTSHTFTLSKGANTIYVRGTDNAGNKGTADIIVTYQEKKEGKPGIIPAFELIYLISALCLALALKRRKRI